MPVKVPPEKRTLQTAGKQAARRVFLRAGRFLSQQRPACLRAAGWAAQVKPPFIQPEVQACNYAPSWPVDSTRQARSFFFLRSQSAAAGLFFRVFTSLRLPGHDAHLLHTAPCHLLYCDMQPLELKLVALCRHTAQGLHDPAAYRNRVKFSLCQAARTHLLHLRRRAPDTRPARAALSAAPRGRARPIFRPRFLPKYLPA